MTTPTFSINAAAEILERDRRTIVKSLRHVRPDAKVRGSAQYRLKTIIDALEAIKPPVAYSGNGVPPGLQRLYDELDENEQAMAALPTPAQRQAAARALIPKIAHAMETLQDHRNSNHQDPDVTGLLVDRLTFLHLRGIEVATGWTHERCWDEYNTITAGPDDDD